MIVLPVTLDMVVLPVAVGSGGQNEKGRSSRCLNALVRVFYVLSRSRENRRLPQGECDAENQPSTDGSNPAVVQHLALRALRCGAPELARVESGFS